MKNTLALLTAAVAVTAVPHVGRRHQKLHVERQVSPVTNVTVVSGPTVVAYVLNGEPISRSEVQEGIRNGTLVWAKHGVLSHHSHHHAMPTPSTTTTSAYTPPPSSTESPPSSSSSPSAYTSTASSTSPPASSPSPAPSSYSPPPSSGNGGGDDSNFDSDWSDGVDTSFPDGELDCSTFPSDYGAISVDWMGLGGWTGVQLPGSDSGGYSDITTVTSGTCSNGQCCTEGAFCSYACPAGYQKTQWPSTQGATGQSVGGIQCTNGKLQLTNPDMSDKLCMTGATEVTVLIENNLSSNVAVCRTDYPGTEGETVPLNAQSGTTSNLTCPDASNYYNWEGAHTSAQYYVNPAGVSVQDACQWGSSSNPWGNYAPLNLGVGYSDGAAWLSIFQNAPTTSAQLDFTVEIQGDGMAGSCRYSNGQYCGGANYDQCSSTTGCTVSIQSNLR